MLLDEVEGACGVETAADDGGSAEHDRRVVRGPEPETEGGGKERHEDVVRPDVAVAAGDLMEVEPAILEVQHALREPGGARGRVDEREVVGADAAGVEVAWNGWVEGLPVDRDVALGIGLEQGQFDVGDDRDAEILDLGPEGGGRCPVVVGEGDERRGLGEAEQVGDFATVGPSAETHGDDPGLLEPEVGGVHGGGVGEQHTDASAGFDPEGDDDRGDPVAGPVEACPSEGAVVGDVSRRVGAFRGVAAEVVDQRVVAPPASGAVGRGVVGIDGVAEAGATVG